MGPWIFASTVLLVTVFPAVRYPRFRRGVIYTLVLVVILAALGAGALYLQSSREKAEQELAKRRISPSDIELIDMRLYRDNVLSSVKGKVKNKSQFTVTRLALKISVQDCSISDECTTIGESDATEWFLNVPPGQIRALDMHVSFPDMPAAKNMRWNYSIVELQGK